MGLLHNATNRCLRIVARATAPGLAALSLVAPLPAPVAAPAAPTRPAPGPLQALGLDVASRPESYKPGPSDDGSGAFVYRNGRFRTLAGVPGAALTAHTGINDRGVIAGSYLDSDGVTTHGFLRSRSGRVTTIDVRGASATYAFDVDNRGRVVGSYLDEQGTAHGFLRATNGSVTELDVPGAAQTLAFGLNDRGQVVGTKVDAQGRNRGFFWEDGSFEALEVPGAAETALYAINDQGQIVGDYFDRGRQRNPDGTYPPNALHGFVWDDGDVTRFDVPSTTLTSALGINNKGVVSGGCADARGRQHRVPARRRTIHDLRRAGRPRRHQRVGHQQPRRSGGPRPGRRRAQGGVAVMMWFDTFGGSTRPRRRVWPIASSSG
jgi:probable HAF family extracellular repeat protein